MLEYITQQRHGEYGFDREWLKDIRKMGYEPLQPGDTSKPIIHLGLVPMRMADR